VTGPKVKWMDPPESKSPGNHAVIRGLLDQLRTRPGQWALIREDVVQGSTGSYKQRYGSEGFEFTSRKTGPGKANLFGRYVGNGNPS
jgi:hypothetical protein